MNGYLSRIAKQSGFQFAAQRPAASASVGGAWNLEPIAPEFEQTRMVEAESIEVSPPGLAPLPGPVPAVEVRREVSAEDDHTSQAAGPHEPRQSQVSRVIPAMLDRKDVPRGESRVVDENGVSRATELAAAPSIVNALVSQESAITRLPTDSVLSVPDTKAFAQAAAPDFKPKEYFVRTAGFLNARDAVTPELQSIVLREVQEWVTAAPAEPPSTDIDPPPAREETQVVKTAQSRAREIASQQAPLIEQSYELSIGAINITIEEDEKPRAFATPTRSPKDAGPGTDRPSSRLRRSYL